VITIPGYKTWATNDVLTAADMNELHADPLPAEIATDEAKTGGTYGDLTTVGPSVTKTLVAGQKALVSVNCNYNAATEGYIAYASFAVSGASTLAALDANGAFIWPIKVTTNGFGSSHRDTVYTATNSGSHTFTMKYRSDGTNNIHFTDRRIIVKPF
jgi:hypothetical protein